MFLAVGAPYHTSSFGGEMKPVFVLGSTLLLPSYVYQRSNISMCSMTMFPRDPQVGVRCGLSATVFPFLWPAFPILTVYRGLFTFPGANVYVQSHILEPAPTTPHRVFQKGRRISDTTNQGNCGTLPSSGPIGDI